MNGFSTSNSQPRQIQVNVTKSTNFNNSHWNQYKSQQQQQQQHNVGNNNKYFRSNTTQSATK